MKKKWILVLCIVVTTGGLYAFSDFISGSTGTRTVIRRYIPPATESTPPGTPRLKIDAPMPGTPITEILVPQELYDNAVEGDTLAFRILILPVFNTDAFDFELKRGGLVAHRWSEGYLFYGGALAIEGVLGGLILMGLILWMISLIRSAVAPKQS